MSSFTLNVTADAIGDLQDIYIYSLNTWGKSKADEYWNRLQSRIHDLVNNPMLGVDRSSLLTGMRSLTVESHVVFYRIDSQTVDILRIQHARQDTGHLSGDMMR